MSISEEDTLPDDAWKDSFDKLLDQRPVLRELKVIKRDVRASFNMNSSYENSGYDGSRLAALASDGETNNKSMQQNNCLATTTAVRYMDLPQNTKEKEGNKRITSKVVSTPVKRSTSNNPFKCTLSPIGRWDLKHFSCDVRNPSTNAVGTIGLNATPINDNIVVNVEYADDENTANKGKEHFINSLEISPLALVKQKWKSKNKKNVCFAETYKTDNTTENFNEEDVIDTSQYPKLDLPPGKWQRSLNCYRRTINKLPENVRNALQEWRALDRTKYLGPTISAAGNRKSICVRPNSMDTKARTRSTYSLECNDFKRQILQRCGQRRILNFSSAYNEEYLKNCCKIGEGAFGEVFVYSNPKAKISYNNNVQKTVLKIIPIEGEQLINGEVQKTYQQILPEIIISMELSALNKDECTQNMTSGFVNLQRVRCVKGQYPSQLQKLWEEYDQRKESENDHPKCFTSNQHYVVLELGFGGEDIETFCFKSAEQSFAALQQVILALAVAERAYKFEHRDLHWGNVLVLHTDQQSISYKLDGETLTIPTKGILITIIDYTLSRMTFDGYCFFNDLSNDEELFSAIGDYQFEIYRLMREVTNDKWDRYIPKTNLFWMSYLISKFIEGVKYKSTRSKNHFLYLDKLEELQRDILVMDSCAEWAREILTF